MEISPIATHRATPADPDDYEPAADIRRIVGIIRRQYKLAIIGAVIAAAFALAVLSVLQPLYLSSVRILLDLNQNQLIAATQGNSPAPSSSAVDDFVATQMAVIQSDVVAQRVARALDLQYDPATKRLSSQPSAGRETRVSPADESVNGSQTVDPAVVDALIKALSVFQVEKSMVIEIDLTDPDPVLAEQLASAYGQAYLDDQLSARYEDARNAGNWLEDRIVRLRDQSLDANAEVQAFREKNNLVSTDGRLVSDQQLQQLNERLSDAQSNLTRAVAREQVFKKAVESKDVDAVLSQIASMPAPPPDAPIVGLRSDYLQARDRLRDVSAKWGAENAQAEAIKAEVDRLSGQILDEARRIGEGLASDVRVARSEVDAIQNSVTSTTSRFQADNSTLVQLRNLEQRAASYNSLYQDYLSRYQEALQQQTLSLTTGRQISGAEVANLPIFPKTKIVLALMVFLGIAFGGAAGLARELMDGSFRTGRPFERLGMSFLGYVALGQKERKRRKGASDEPLAAIDAGSRQALATVLSRTRIAVEMRRREGNKIIGLLSTHRAEARSEMALLMARFEAARGHRVLLVDGDTSHHRLTELVRSKGLSTEFSDATGGETLKIVSLADGLDFQPSGSAQNGLLMSDVMTSDQIDLLRGHYESIFIDLPTAEPISEARAFATMFDAFVFVAEWGKSSVDDLQTLLRTSTNIRNRLAGAVLVVTKPRKLLPYDRAGARTLLGKAR